VCQDCTLHSGGGSCRPIWLVLDRADDGRGIWEGNESSRGIDRTSVLHGVWPGICEYLDLLTFQDRYWGASVPFKILDTKAMQHHTLENAVADMVNFARNVQLPFDQGGSSNAPRAVGRYQRSFPEET